MSIPPLLPSWIWRRSTASSSCRRRPHPRTQHVFEPVVETPTAPATDGIKDFSALMGVPPRINAGLSPAGAATMLSIFGAPGELTTDCSPVTQKKVIDLLETADVGPFRIRGIKPAVLAVQRTLKAARAAHPDLHAQLGTQGMLCCRRVRRPGSRSFSNHSWGTAIDLTFDGKTDKVDDGLCQVALLMLAPFFNAERFYWGAGFSAEDSMHFEASEQLIKEWHRNGII